MQEVMKLDSAVPARQEPTVLEVIQQLAVDPRVDVDKLAALMGLQERVEARNAKQEFTAAFARLQLSLPRIKKNWTIDLGRGKPIPFAKWEDVDTAIRPILAAHGFSLSFQTRVDNGALVMACVLTHTSGHSERSEDTVKPDEGPGRNSSQAKGSGRAYTKRYLAMDMLNLVAEGQDDDANSTDLVNEKQLSNLTDMVNSCEFSPVQMAAFLKWVPATAIEKIKARDYQRVMDFLKTKVKP